MLKTETPAQDHATLDQYPTTELVNVFVDDQVKAVEAVRAAAPRIAAAITAALPRIEAGGRLIYVGAGTSGRLGVLDSVELYPTFSWPHERAVALLAGGIDAMFVAVEGAEDDTADLVNDDHDSARQQIDVGPTESLALQIEAALVILKSRNRTNDHGLGISVLARCHNASISFNFTWPSDLPCRASSVSMN